MPPKKLKPRFLGYKHIELPVPENFINPLLCQPKSLFDLAAAVANALPKPDCWDWSPHDVANWIANDLQLPQYMDCFITNNVMGKKLVIMEASILPKINITVFEHIKIITEGIRNLLKIDYERFKRSISLPPRKLQFIYLYYLYTRGIQATRVEVYRIWKILKEEEKPYSIWDPPTKPCPFIIGLPHSKINTEPRIRTINLECYDNENWMDFLIEYNLIPPQISSEASSCTLSD